MFDEKSIQDTKVQSHIRHQLHASKSKIILLCGMRDARFVLQTGDAHTLRIRGFTYRADYDRSENQLFVRCRTLPIKATGLDAKNASSICEINKFAGIIGKVGRLHPYFLQSSSAISFIIRQRALERQGAPNMTTETLDPSIKTWLGRKGFNKDEDILELEKLSGSSTSGLLLMLQCLPQCPPEWKNNEAVASNGDRVHRGSDNKVPRRFVYLRKSDLRDHPELRGYLNGSYSPGTLGCEGEIEDQSGKGYEIEDEN